MRSSWTNIHNIILKLCLNPNYKQVLGELSQPVITGSTPGHRVRRTVALKGSSLLGSVQQSSSVRGKRHTTRVLYDVLNSVIDFMMIIKVSYAHVTGLYWGMAHVANITNAILYIGLMAWCHESLHLEKIPSWSRLKIAHYVSKPFDLLEITITFLLQLRKFW